MSLYRPLLMAWLRKYHVQDFDLDDRRPDARGADGRRERFAHV